MSLSVPKADAVTIATAIRAGEITAQAIVEATLDAITHHNPTLNCFTTVTTQVAQQQASRVDRAVEGAAPLGSLAGATFAVKGLFDIAGETTLAGSKILAERPPASTDATVVAKLKQAGGILVGTLNMDEFAYGFVTQNSHYGTTHNPHDLTRIAGGSSGGSAAAVAAGLVPLAIGTDTNGSVRVPAALCGVYGFKPTYGRISRAGAVLLASSLDHVGIFGRSVRDIATTYDFLQGEDLRDPVVTNLPPEPTIPQLNLGTNGIRIAVAGGYFAEGADPEALEAVEMIAQALQKRYAHAHNSLPQVMLPESERARAAAYVITAAESANLHLQQLRSRPQDFDPATRDRFLAGAMIPSAWLLQAQRFRSWYRDRVRDVFQSVDLILAPTTPCVAPTLEQARHVNLGRFTQPLSLIGLPVLSIPIHRPHALPLGVQIIAAPYDEAVILRVANYLERQGVIAAPVASL